MNAIQQHNFQEYKRIVICILCRKGYGTDYGRNENKICPKCALKMRRYDD